MVLREFLLQRSCEKVEEPRVVAWGAASGDVAVGAYDRSLREAGACYHADRGTRVPRSILQRSTTVEPSTLQPSW